MLSDTAYQAAIDAGERDVSYAFLPADGDRFRQLDRPAHVGDDPEARRFFQRKLTRSRLALTLGPLVKPLLRLGHVPEAQRYAGHPQVVDLRRSSRGWVLAPGQSFDFASEWFARRYGFDYYNGIQLAYSDAGTLTGEVLRHVDEEDKARFVRSRASAAGVDLDDVFYVGDSRSDLPTFDIVGFSVAVNGSRLAVAAATAAVETKSLRDVLELVPGLSDQRSC